MLLSVRCGRGEQQARASEAITLDYCTSCATDYFTVRGFQPWACVGQLMVHVPKLRITGRYTRASGMAEGISHPLPVTAEKLLLLSQLEIELDTVDTLDQRGGAKAVGGDGETRAVDGMLEELKDQAAGILQDRNGSSIVEKIARRLNTGQLAVLLSGCRGYMDSLASNKLSAHVLGDLLRLASEAIEAELGATGKSNGVTNTRERKGEPLRAAYSRTEGQALLQVLGNVILSLVSELSSALSTSTGKTWAKILSQNFTSSVVGLRLLANLGGVRMSKRPLKPPPIRAGKRALREPAQGERNYGGDPETTVFVGPGAAADQDQAAFSRLSPMMESEVAPTWYKPPKYRVPASFRAALEGITEELADLPAGEVQGLVYNRHAYRSLELLLEMHTTSSSASVAGPAESPQLARLEQGSPAMKLVARALEWEDGDEERSSDIVCGMAKDKWGSRFLLTVVRLAPQDFFLELYRRCFQDR